jgi:hypothetical protein
VGRLDDLASDETTSRLDIASHTTGNGREFECWRKSAAVKRDGFGVPAFIWSFLGK